MPCLLLLAACGIGGIAPDPEAPGYANAIIRPRPGGGINHAKASLDSARGRVETAWRQDGNGFSLEVTIPANAGATLYFPHGDPAAIREDAAGDRLAQEAPGVELLRVEGGETVYRIRSGRYRFRQTSP